MKIKDTMDSAATRTGGMLHSSYLLNKHYVYYNIAIQQQQRQNAYTNTHQNNNNDESNLYIGSIPMSIYL